MTLPAFEHWDDTRQTLHQAAQIIGAVRRDVASPEPNWTHLGLTVVPAGLTTGIISVGEFTLDFVQGKIVYVTPAGIKHDMVLEGHTQQSLATKVESTLQSTGFDTMLDHEKLSGSVDLTLDLSIAADYAGVLNIIWMTLGEFRASLDGYTTRLVVWGHGFDAAFLWFASSAAADEGQDPHLGIGFSPGSPGLDRPYFYIYAWPVADGLIDTALPPLAHWHTEGWTGVLLDYDVVRQEADPAAIIKQTLQGIFEAVSPHI